MKLLVLASNLSTVGGIQTYNKKFISALQNEGEKVEVVELRDTTIVSKIRFACAFLFRALVWRPNLALATNVNFSPLAYLARAFFGTPYTVTIYGIEVAPVWSSMKKHALSRALLVIKLFNQAERDVVRQIPTLKGKIISIPNSVDDKRFTIHLTKPRELMERHGLTKAKVALTICRLSSSERDNKGYAKVIRAFPEVLKKVPNARYLLVGGGDDKGATESLVENLGLRGKVIFPGAAKDEEMAEYYNLADVFVYPSQREGFPSIVLLEALVCGVPAVSGNQPDASGSIFDGDVGLTVVPDNAEALAGAIIAVLEKRSPALAGAKEKIRERVLTQYGIKAYQTHVKEFIARARRELSSIK